jgi:hypothetical protein
MAKPKLALIPAAQGSKLYSVLPSSGVGDFSFTRSGSATRISAQGLIETVASGVSRLNYPMIDGVVKGCPHHILEPQRTNYIINSQSISLSPIKNGTFTDNFAISPDGTLNATKITATDTDPYFYQSVSFAAATYTASIYVKGIGSSIGKEFRIAIGSSSSNPKLEIPSEWTRFEYSVSMASGSANTGLEILDPAVVGDEVLVWGWQVENGSYATSYITNNGTAAGVTRSAETANGSGDAATFNDSEGVLMAEISALSDDGTYRQLGITNFPSHSYQVNISLENNSNKLAGVILSNNVYYVLDYEVQDTKTKNKVALKYKVNDLAFYVNGFKVSAINTAPISTGLNVLKFSAGNNAIPFYGNTKQLQYFDTALTDSELEQLTSWVSFQEMAEGQLYTIE